MAYDKSMFDPVGLAALDPKVAAYKKFIKENLNQPDLLQFLQSEQGKRLDPNLAGAMLVLEKLEEAKNSAASGPAPTTTVVQDVSNAAMQEAQRQGVAMPQGQGIAQLPNPAMDNAQFQGGIAQPPQQMAGGGIVALAGGGGLQGIDFTKMDPEQLEILSKDEDLKVAQAATREYLRRTGYRTIGQRWDEVMQERDEFLKRNLPLVRYDPRPFPAHMYDEQGRVRTPGMGGPVTYSLTEGIVPLKKREEVPDAAAPAAPTGAQTSPVSALPTATNPFSLAGRAERQALDVMEAMRGRPEATGERGGRRQTGVPGTRSAVPAASGARPAAGGDEMPKVKSIEGYEQELVDLYAKRGIGKAADEYRKYLQEERDNLKEQGRVDASLALAKAGFRMMASTSPFAAVGIGEGGQEYASQMMAIRKDQQANNRSMREAQFRLAQADEAQAAGRINQAMSMRSDAEKQLRDATQHREMMQFRYAQLANEERRHRATLDMQRAVLEAQGAKDDNAARVRLATARQGAIEALSQDTIYMGLQSALQKAVGEGDEIAIKKAEKAVRSYREDFLAPIDSAIGEAGAGATSSVVDWNDLFG